MKKIAKIILTVVFALAGFAIVIFGIFLAFQSSNWPTTGFAITLVLFGIVSIIGAWGLQKASDYETC